MRGLGDSVKCGDVLAELLSSTPNLVLLQETKLADIPKHKLYSFLPRRLNNFHCASANGSCEGILSAWSDSFFSSIGSSSTTNTISTLLASTTTNLALFITNVYASSSHELRPAFLDELKSISPPTNTP